MGLAVLAAVAVWFFAIRDSELTPGPLGSEDVSSVGVPQRVGQPVAFGLPQVFNRGDKDAILESISIVGLPAGLELIDARINGPERKINSAYDFRWPSPDYTDLRPVKGHRVAPLDSPTGERGAELVFAFRADEPGRYTFKAVQVDYRVGDTRHRVRIRNGLSACFTAPGSGRAPRCPAPTGL